MGHRDEILEELHRIRAEILKEAGGTVEGLFARVAVAQRRERRALVTRRPRPHRRGRGKPAL